VNTPLLHQMQNFELDLNSKEENVNNQTKQNLKKYSFQALMDVNWSKKLFLELLSVSIECMA
jgi:hypothetical protein